MRDDDVIAQSGGDSLVLFHMQSGNYFSLNECGTRIWDACDGTRTEQDIAQLLAEEYDAPAAVQDDVSALLLQLRDRGLLKLVDQG
jgi:PqqD family protein of HPr-rel-A system